MHRKDQKKTLFSEGWVEFLSKKVAKQAALTLNNTPVTMKRNSRFSELVWNVCYLKGFEFELLATRDTYERKVQEKLHKAELLRVRREVTDYLERSERDRTNHIVTEKKKRRQKRRNDNDDDDDEEEEETKEGTTTREIDQRFTRQFKQKKRREK